MRPWHRSRSRRGRLTLEVFRGNFPHPPTGSPLDPFRAMTGGHLITPDPRVPDPAPPNPDPALVIECDDEAQLAIIRDVVTRLGARVSAAKTGGE